jgi:hypothetical protein
MIYLSLLFLDEILFNIWDWKNFSKKWSFVKSIPAVQCKRTLGLSLAVGWTT